MISQDVKSKPNLDCIFRPHIGYMDLKTIDTSLDYFQHLWKNLYAMIQQLGP